MRQVVDVTSIARIDMFSELDDGQLSRLAAVAREIRLGRGKLLFQTGDEANGLYALCRGKVKIFRTSPAGKEKILHVIEPGAVFAEVAVFEGGVFPADAQAMEDSDLIFFPRRDFKKLLAEDPDFALAMMALMARRLRRLVSQIDHLSLKEVPARLASHLLVLGASHGTTTFALDLPKGQLAAYLGTIPETLSRVLRKFSDQGLITVEGKQVTILDSLGLEDAAEGEG